MKPYWMIIIVALLLIGGVAAYVSLSKPSTTESNSGDVRVITLDAQRFQYSPATITVKKGERVRIEVNSIDTAHGIMIPDFGVSGVESVEFVADKTGTFNFNCPTFCGEGHRNMKGTLVVTD